MAADGAHSRHASEYIFEALEVAERPRHLEGSTDPEPRASPCRQRCHISSMQPYRSGVGPQAAGNDAEERCFACAIWPEQSNDLADGYFHVDAPHSVHAAETLIKLSGAQDARHSAASLRGVDGAAGSDLRRRRCVRNGTSPMGMKRITNSSIMPI